MILLYVARRFTPAHPGLSVCCVHLGSHPADCRHVIAGADEVPGVLLQLELAQPLMNGLCVLENIGVCLLMTDSWTDVESFCTALLYLPIQQLLRTNELLRKTLLRRSLHRHRLPARRPTCTTAQTSVRRNTLFLFSSF